MLCTSTAPRWSITGHVGGAEATCEHSAGQSCRCAVPASRAVPHPAAAAAASARIAYVDPYIESRDAQRSHTNLFGRRSLSEPSQIGHVTSLRVHFSRFSRGV